MRARMLFVGAVLAAVVTPTRPAAAQNDARRPDRDRGRAERAGPDDAARSVLGLVISYSGGDRDTLGVLVSQVVRDGPADWGGIDVGNRIMDVDGASLALDQDDVGDRGAEESVLRRLDRQLRALRPGDVTVLRVYAAGRARTVRVRTAGGDAGDADTEVTVPRDTAVQASLASVLDAMATLQSQLHQLSQDAATDAMADTLAAAEQELSDLRRRLVATRERPRRRSVERTGRDASGGGGTVSLPGLRLTPVGEGLSDYFGEGSDQGLLVLQADDRWDPIEVGDVLLRVNGDPVDEQALRAVLASRRESTVDLLRRKRRLTVTLGGRE